MFKAKRIFLIFFCLVMLFLWPVTNLNGGVAYQLDFSSRYIWRGFDLNPQNKPVLQPSITYSFGDSGLAVNVWGSFSFENKELNELDLTLSYDFSISEKLSLSIGFIHYGWYFGEVFSFEDDTTQELFVSVGFPKILFSPNISLYYDLNLGDGYYLSLGTGHSLPISDKLNLDLSASLGYNGKQWIEESGFSDLNLGVSLPLKLNKLTLSPFFNFSLVLLDEVNPGVDNEVYFGVSASF